MDQAQFTSLFCENLTRNGLETYTNPGIAGSFYRLTCLLTEANAKMNLTAIRKEADMIPLHYADCLLAAKYLPEGARVLDCGCGAGFPTLPLAIVRPDLQITALDSTAKKLGFVESTAKALELENISVICARAEELAAKHKYREAFDAVTGRAVARLNVLSELCIPFVRVGGLFLAMKAAKGAEELKEARGALKQLGCDEYDGISVVLATFDEQETRYLIPAKKARATPQIYPRKYAQIVKNPL